jgi:lactate racemase
LSASDRKLTGVPVIDSVEQAVMKSMREKGDAQVAVIPEGPYLVPVYRPAN